MRAKLIVEGKEFVIDIMDPELAKLVQPEKKTGYEKVKEYNKVYYYITGSGDIMLSRSSNDPCEKSHYENASYYSDKTVAENNARADKLMRQLRRFAVENRVNNIDWNDEHLKKYTIRFSYASKELFCDSEVLGRDFGNIPFDSEDAAKAAIKAFHDELIWYFTEYKDSL